MNVLSLELPNSLLEQARALAQQEGISINQLIATALAEKMSALMTEEYLEERARRGSRTRYARALGEVPDTEPEAYDARPGAAKRVAEVPASRRRTGRKRPQGRRRS